MARNYSWMSSRIVDLIAAGNSPQSITEQIKGGLYEKATESIDLVRPWVFENLLDPDNGEKMPELKNADKMKKQTYADQVQKKKQNDEKLKTGENAADNIQVDAFPGETPKSAGMGTFNPRGVPQKNYAGDRRKGFIPPGGGV